MIEALQGDICVNNSYSGSKASGVDFPSASCDERLRGLKTEIQNPNLILVYIGYNDWGYGVPVKKKTGSFEEGYKRILEGLKMLYPTSRIICGTLMRTSLKKEPSWKFPEEYAGISLSKYNDMIRKLCRDENVELADLEKKNIRYETLDGSHPTTLGHSQIAEAWIECCKELDRVRYDNIPEYNLRYLKDIHQLKEGNKDYRIEVAVQPEVKITLEMKGWQTSDDAMKMLGEMNLVGDRQRFKDWPKANPASGPGIHHRSALVCELDNKMTYHIELYNPNRMVCLYGCPNARTLRNCKPKKSVEIIKYE